MFKRELRKPDGRELVLYARNPLPDGIEAPAAGLASKPRSHLRWHPLRAEWVVYAEHRQHRTFLPPPEWNPLAPSSDAAHPTEVPQGPWDVAVFENLFPAFGSAEGGCPPDEIVPIARGSGRCEVVVFAQDARASLATLPLDQIELIVAVWADRTRALGARPEIEYVFPFENRGVEVGVTLAHPHGQIYGYPFVPPVMVRQLELQRQYKEEHQRGLLADLIAAELLADRRTLFVGSHAIAWVPVCARWAYEIWVAPRREAPTLADLAVDERRDFALALQVAVRKLDALWQQPMPYVLAVYQAPLRGTHDYAHVHVQIMPWYRMKSRVKFLAGSEVAAGVFTADTLPEATAAELRAVEVAHG